MNIPEQDIINVLRRAPVPKPPAGLKQQLISQLPSAPARSQVDSSHGSLTGGLPAIPSPISWFRRWWPVLAPAAGSLACAAVLAMQHLEIRDLQAANAARSQSPTAEPQPSVVPQETAAEAALSSGGYDQEISRLKQTVAELEAEVARLEQLRAQNNKLRAAITSRAAAVLSPDEAEALAKARERADSVRCVNNLKQFGLAARTWSLDNQDILPPNIVCMSNELSTPKILVCPADTTRPVAPDFSYFTTANCSYEFLAPLGSESEPTRVLSRCPIHGTVGLVDGSVQMGVSKTHPDWLVQRDGKLYMEAPKPANTPNP
jgi:hypothetical protein